MKPKGLPRARKAPQKPICWQDVERICLRSFTGSFLTLDEHRVLADAYRRDPEEYIRRTSAVRDQERERLRTL